MVITPRCYDLVMPIKYVLRPGYTYNHDGCSHRIDANHLIDLYDVPANECIVLENHDSKFNEKLYRYISLGYIFLYPRSDSNYSWLKQMTG